MGCLSLLDYLSYISAIPIGCMNAERLILWNRNNKFLGFLSFICAGPFSDSGPFQPENK
jgi:hypothetical protein